MLSTIAEFPCNTNEWLHSYMAAAVVTRVVAILLSLSLYFVFIVTLTKAKVTDNDETRSTHCTEKQKWRQLKLCHTEKKIEQPWDWTEKITGGEISEGWTPNMQVLDLLHNTKIKNVSCGPLSHKSWGEEFKINNLVCLPYTNSCRISLEIVMCKHVNSYRSFKEFAISLLWTTGHLNSKKLPPIKVW